MQFLIRYSEIGLKSSPVRIRFEKILIRNIEDFFLKENLECIFRREFGRIFLYCDNEKKAIKILKKVFGISSISIVEECSSELNELKNFVLEYAKKILNNGESFAIDTRRVGEHPYSSVDVNKIIGKVVLNANKHKNIKVNLSSPNKTIFIEIRQNKAYIFSEKINGVGGLPLDSQGRVLCLISSENDILGSWLLMKRGCGIIPIFDKDLKEKYKKKFIKILKYWNPKVKIKDFYNEHYIIRKKLDLKKIAKEFKAEGIVVGEKFEEIRKRRIEIPIFYPLVGLSNEEIEELKGKVLKIVK